MSGIVSPVTDAGILPQAGASAVIAAALLVRRRDISGMFGLAGRTSVITFGHREGLQWPVLARRLGCRERRGGAGLHAGPYMPLLTRARGNRRGGLFELFRRAFTLAFVSGSTPETSTQDFNPRLLRISNYVSREGPGPPVQLGKFPAAVAVKQVVVNISTLFIHTVRIARETS